VTSQLDGLLSERTIATGLVCQGAEEAIRALAALLVAEGCVAPAFADDVWAREQVYPTGLPTEPVRVALPHADPDHVLRTAIAVAVLAQPVAFGEMGSDGSSTLPVEILFMLAIKEREKQVGMICAVAETIQSPQLLQGLMRAAGPHQVLELLVGRAGSDVDDSRPSGSPH